MNKLILKLTALLALLAITPASAQDALLSENIVFPADAGVIDVTAAPYNADKTGVTDATAAIQQAINVARGYLKNKIVYLPDGTYRLTNRLVFSQDQALQRGLTFQGQSRTGTILKLDDNLALAATGQNLPVLKCFEPATGTQTFNNSAFSTNIANLTIDVGAGNPGAAGINYVANNQSYIRNVLIRSSDPGKVGRSGLEIATAIPGPALVKNLTVDGFSVGLRTRMVQYGITLENITLRNQVQYAVRNDAQTLSIRHLLSENTVPAISQVTGGESKGIITLIDSQLNGGDPANYGIELTDGFLFARNVSTTGYASALLAYGTPVAGSAIAEYVGNGSGTGAAVSLQSPQATSLNLPILETPEPARDPVSTWKSVGDSYVDVNGVTQPGAIPGDNIDDTAAIQAALNSGASTVYFPNPKNVAFTTAANITQEETGSRYRVSATLVVGAAVTRVMGLGTGIQPVSTFNSDPANLPIFQFVNNGTRRTIVLENFRTASNNSKCIFIEQASNNTLVLRGLSIRNGYGYRNTGITTGPNPGVGAVFIEDFHVLPLASTANSYAINTLPGFTFKNQRVWARQINPEQCNTNIVNDGSTLWILGLKTEFPNTVIKTMNDGETEVLGGFVLPARPTNFADAQSATAYEHPAFVNDNSSVSVAGYGEARTNSAAPSSTSGNVFTNAVAETRGTTTTTLAGASLPQRKSQSNTGSFTSFVLPLYTGYLVPTPLPVELTRFTAERTGTVARLNWATASEKNCAGFEIQVSRDGRAFRRLGWQAGQGNSARPVAYRFDDAVLLDYGVPVVYYRLLQRDLDGSSTISSVRAVPTTDGAQPLVGLSAWPNPAPGNGSVTVAGVPVGKSLQVYDALGHLVLTVPAAASLQAVQLPPSAGRGIYLVRAGTQSCRLVVE